ncbi:hypothetical protein WAF17_05995 [Bernardetia sp. ABR2-2B]|uniref:hypothetical protein n=1 Tax=Bernardetia sp. ABR2-2B TaxID=3127472 RepID=UPI0030D1E07A
MIFQNKTFFLWLLVLPIVLFTSCHRDKDKNPRHNDTQIPSNLTIEDNNFYPEDIVITNNTVYVSGLGDGTLRSFDLTEDEPTAQLFANAETGFSQG